MQRPIDHPPHPLSSLVALANALALCLAPALAAQAEAPAAEETTAGGTAAEEAEARPEEARFADELTVTATTTPRAVSATPGSVTVIGAEELDRRLAFGIEDVARYEPGLTVERDATRLGANGFTIRGIGGNRVLTRVDGVPVAESFAFGPQAMPQLGFDLEALASIEVVKSAGSSLYGSDALGGVVSLLTSDPEDYLRLSGRSPHAGLELGHDGRNAGSAGTLTTAVEHGAWRASLLATHRVGEEVDNQGTLASEGADRTAPNPQDLEATDVLGKVVWQQAPQSRFELALESFAAETDTDVLSARVADDMSAQFGPGVTFVLATEDLVATDAQDRLRVSLEHDWQAGAAGSLVDRIAWRAYHQDSTTQQDTVELRATTIGGSFFGPLRTTRARIDGTMELEQETFGGELQLQKGLLRSHGDHLVTWGVNAGVDHFDMFRDRLQSDPETGVVIPESSGIVYPTKYFPESEVRELGVFVQDEASLFGGRLLVVPGVRYDSYRLDPDEHDPVYLAGNEGTELPVGMESSAVSPRLGLVWRIGREVTGHAQYARGFRAPPYSAVNNGFTNLGHGYTTLPNPDLEPETSDNIEVGLRGASRRGAWSLALFENRYDGFIDTVTLGIDPATGIVQFRPENLEDVEVRGVELSGRLTLGHGFTVLGAGTWSDGEVTSDGRPLDSVAPPQAVVGLRYDAPRGRWGAELVTTAVDGKDEDDVDRSTLEQFAPPGYEVVDLTAYVALGGRTRLSVGVFNLLDETYWSWTTVRGQEAGSPTLDRYTAPGINAAASLHVRF